MNLLSRLRSGSRSIGSLEDYVAALNSFMYQGNTYGLSGYGAQQTLNGSPVENVEHSFVGYAGITRSNGPVFACMLARQSVFSAVRFQFQQMRDGRPGQFFGTQALSVLESPHTGGTTQDFLVRMIQDADLAGNSYHVSHSDAESGSRPLGELVRLRPDWVSLLLEKNPLTGTYRKLAYLFHEDGVMGAGSDPRIFWPEHVAHFAPIPDPLASYRGMSWLTPVIRELQVDGQMTDHKRKFFENAATPNMIIHSKEMISEEAFKKLVATVEHKYSGAVNAFKTMVIGAGADATVVGSDLKNLEFKATQGAGETRIAAAAGVPPIIVGLSEGLEAATYSNYGQARRRFADGTIHPLWQNAAGSIAPLVPAPSGSRLWYDARDVPFLREDEKDAADIQGVRARTLRSLLDAGYTPESAVDAVETDDFSRLKHSGLFSVQLQKPGEHVEGKGKPVTQETE